MTLEESHLCLLLHFLVIALHVEKCSIQRKSSLNDPANFFHVNLLFLVLRHTLQRLLDMSKYGLLALLACGLGRFTRDRGGSLTNALLTKRMTALDEYQGKSLDILQRWRCLLILLDRGWRALLAILV